MKTITLTNAKPPKFYNQGYWLCLRQRNAWLLQRWLKNGDPFFFFTEEGTPVFISDEQELSVLFEKKEKYAVRYVEDTYWIIWEESGYYFVLNPHSYFNNKESGERFFPSKINNEYFANLRTAVLSTLISLYETQEIPKIMVELDMKVKNRFANCQAIYSELDKGDCVGFYARTKFYSIQSPVLLNCFGSNANN